MALLGVDAGTSGTKAVLFSDQGEVIAQANRTYDRVYPQPGWIELDCGVLIGAVRETIAEAANKAGDDPIKGMCISTFGGGATLLDAQGKPLYNVISTTDNRAKGETDAWCERFGHERSYLITGVTVHPSLILAKALWLKHNRPELWEKTDKIATVAELMLADLGLPVKVDECTASTYMALDIRKRDWSQEILDEVGIEREKLGEVKPSGTIVGELSASIAKELNLPAGLPVALGGQDTQVCALGVGLTNPDVGISGLGTVQSIVVAFPEPHLDTSMMCYPNLLHVYGDLVTYSAYQYCFGDLFNWFVREFTPEQTGSAALEALFQAMPEEPANLFVLPHFSGAATPYMDPASRGVVVGLRLDHTSKDMFRAIVDSQDYEMRLNLEIWKRAGIQVDRVRAWGGGAHNNRLLQIMSDICELEIHQLEFKEAGCLGDAILAGAAVGVIPDVDAFLEKVVKVRQVFQPDPKHRDLYAERFELYKKIYPAVADISHQLP